MIKRAIQSPIVRAVRRAIGESGSGGSVPSPYLFPSGTVVFSTPVNFSKLVGVF